MRQINPILAALANFAGLGLGYVYGGRIHVGFVVIGTIYGVFALTGWSRFMFNPSAVYVVAILMLTIVLSTVAHCAVITAHNHSAPAGKYNRWWFYLLTTHPSFQGPKGQL